MNKSVQPPVLQIEVGWVHLNSTIMPGIGCHTTVQDEGGTAAG